MSKQSKAGRYYEPMPADFEILDRLPVAGILGGVHWAGRPVRGLARDLRETFPDGGITETFVTARLRSMKVAGFVSDHAAVGSRIWAKTPDGERHARTREEVLGG